MSSVRAILARRKYTGTFVYGAQNSGKYFAMRDGEVTPRRKSDKTLSASPIIHENKFEAIVPQEQFDRVQRRLTGRQGSTARKQARQYLLAGLVKCGDCGGALGGITGNGKPVYHCRTYHGSGSTSCHRNMIEEAPLVEVVVRTIRERYLSESALARFRRSLEAVQDWTRPRPRDLVRKIDNAETAVLDAPANSRSGLYRKLEEFNSQRDQIKTELEALISHQAKPDRKDGSEIDQAIKALQDLSQAFKNAGPTDTKQLLGSIVTKIELHFKHETTSGGRERNVFSRGRIHLRPDAGEARSTNPDSSHMNTKGPYSGTFIRARARLHESFNDVACIAPSTPIIPSSPAAGTPAARFRSQLCMLPALSGKGNWVWAATVGLG